MSSWQDRIVGERMRVDSEFEDRVEASSFSRQQWGLVMTAISFEIEDAADPENARLVADTSNLANVMDEVATIDERSQMMGGDDSGSLLDSVKDLLGVGDADAETDELRAEAESLTMEYAEALQNRLEENGRWTEVREAAQ